MDGCVLDVTAKALSSAGRTAPAPAARPQRAQGRASCVCADARRQVSGRCDHIDNVSSTCVPAKQCEHGDTLLRCPDNCYLEKQSCTLWVLFLIIDVNLLIYS